MTSRMSRIGWRATLAALTVLLASCGEGNALCVSKIGLPYSCNADAGPGSAVTDKAENLAGTPQPPASGSTPEFAPSPAPTLATTPDPAPGPASAPTPAPSPGPTQSAPPMPVAPVLSATGTSGTLSLTWTASADATRYVVQKRLGAGAWNDDGAMLSAGTLTTDRKVPVADWSQASFRVQACNVTGCTASADVQALTSMAGTIRYLKAHNTSAGDLFGWPVALSGDGNTLAVGARSEDSAGTGTSSTGTDDSATDSGAVYVFTRSAGVWTQQAYLKASNTDAGDNFGFAIALSTDGNTLAVGASSEDSAETGVGNVGADNSAAASGAVYVFTRNAGVWTQQAYIKASNTGAGDSFGWTVALSADGDTLAVGAAGEDSAETGVGGTGADNAAPNSGAVYVFTRSSGTWSQQAYLKASNTGAGDSFGSSVALSADGSTLAVGAPLEDSAETGTSGTGADEGSAESGAVYVFTRTAGVWTQQAYLKAFNTGAGDRFGGSVALSADGNTLAVAAGNEDSAETGTNGTGTSNTATDSGAAYVFTRSAGSWSQQAYIKASNTGAGDSFSRVAISGDGNTLAVSAMWEDSNETGVTGTGANNSASSAGAVYVYVRDAGTWTQRAYLKATNAAANDLFGTGIALSGDGGTLVVGAAYEDSAETGTTGTGTSNAAVDSGAVYTF